jgi:hypothetical protein
VIEEQSDEHIGIERAFEVLRNHTVHTKGYVLTALQFIAEYGSVEDKSVLESLMKEKSQALDLPARVAAKPASTPDVSIAPVGYTLAKDSSLSPDVQVPPVKTAKSPAKATTRSKAKVAKQERPLK